MSPSDQPNGEQRQFTRVPFGGEATVDYPAGPYRGRLDDISLKGVLLHRPEGWPGLLERTTPVELNIELESGLRLRATAQVAHVEETLAGFEFTQMPLETASSLRRLVEFNLGDESLLERELGALIHVHEDG